MPEEHFRQVPAFVLNPSIPGAGEGGAKIELDKLLIDISTVRGLSVTEARRFRDWLDSALDDR
jgi:hypothetical protein